MRLLKQDPYYGFVRLATALAHVKVGDPEYNLERHIGLVRQMADNRVDIGQFGECSITGYSCGRYFQQKALQDAAVEALVQLRDATRDIFPGMLIVGAPLVIDDALYNCGIAMCRGKFLGISVKRTPPNYEEFIELKWFAYGRNLRSKFVMLSGQKVPVGYNLIFECRDVDNLKVAIPICEDDWTQAASSFFYASAGATVLCSLNGSDELVGKEDYRRDAQVTGMSARCIAGYAYSSQGPGESTTDVAFSGHMAIADNGSLQAELKPLTWLDTIADPERRGESLIMGDIDLDHIRYDRQRTNSFIEAASEMARMRKHRFIPFTLERPAEPRALVRKVPAHPYVPDDPAVLANVCDKIVKIKLAGDVQRLLAVGNPDVWVAFSGGLDSTARLLDAINAKKQLGRPASEVHAVTMPGFGTGKRSYGNVIGLCGALGVTLNEVDIRPLCLTIWKAMGHKPFGIDLARLAAVSDPSNAPYQDRFTFNTPLPSGRRAASRPYEDDAHHPGGRSDQPAGALETELGLFLQELARVPQGSSDLVFENVQAHVRTLIITRLGFSFGTADMSEGIIGWCTWLADQLGGHYNSQATMPKTLVRFQVKFQAQHQFEGAARERLLDIVGQDVSAELLPTLATGEVVQKTDDVNGPEEVRDFFMRYFRRYGDPPEKILFLFEHVNRRGEFNRMYGQEEVLGWWQRFATRTFQQRYKNACRTDGVQVGSDSLSPHGNWIVPSDASPALWQLPQGFDLAPIFARIDAQLAAKAG